MVRAAFDRDLIPKAPRRGGRVVDCTALEMRHTRKGIGGSNPSLSAIFSKLLLAVEVCLDLQGSQTDGTATSLMPAALRLAAAASTPSRAIGAQVAAGPRTPWF